MGQVSLSQREFVWASKLLCKLSFALASKEARDPESVHSVCSRGRCEDTKARDMVTSSLESHCRVVWLLWDAWCLGEGKA